MTQIATNPNPWQTPVAKRQKLSGLDVKKMTQNVSQNSLDDTGTLSVEHLWFTIY